MDAVELLSKYLPEGVEPYPFQISAIEKLYKDRIAFVTAPTGMGKSLTFQIPAIEFDSEGIVVIFSPLVALRDDHRRKLMQTTNQFQDSAELIVLNTATANKLGRSHKQIVLVEPDVLVSGNPLGDALRAHAKDIKLVVIDEVHLLITWGLTFRPAMRALPGFWKELKQYSPRLICLSAEKDRYIIQKSLADFGLSEACCVSNKQEHRHRRRISAVLADSPEQMEYILIRQLRIMLKKYDRGVVFCKTRSSAFYLAQLVRHCLGSECRVLLFHAGLLRDDKQAILDQLQDSKFEVVIATTSLSTGVDLDLDFCIHYELPYSMLQYRQEMGRIGRSSLSDRSSKRSPGTAILIFRKDELSTLSKSQCEIPSIKDDFYTIANFCENSRIPVTTRDIKNLLIAKRLTLKSKQFPKAYIQYRDLLLQYLSATKLIVLEPESNRLQRTSFKESGYSRAAHKLAKYLEFVYQDRRALRDFADLLMRRQRYHNEYATHKSLLRQGALASNASEQIIKELGRVSDTDKQSLSQFHDEKVKEVYHNLGDGARIFVHHIEYGNRGSNEAPNAGLLERFSKTIELLLHEQLKEHVGKTYALHSAITVLPRDGFSIVHSLRNKLADIGAPIGVLEELPNKKSEAKRRPNCDLIWLIDPITRVRDVTRHIHNVLATKQFSNIIMIAQSHYIYFGKRVQLPEVAVYAKKATSMLLDKDLPDLAKQLLQMNQKNRHASKARLGLKNSRQRGLEAFLALMRKRLIDYRVNLRPYLGLTPKLFQRPVGMNIKLKASFDSIMKYWPKSYHKLNRFRAQDIVRVGFVPVAMTEIEPYWTDKAPGKIFAQMFKEGLMHKIDHEYRLGKGKEGRARAYLLDADAIEEYLEYQDIPLSVFIEYTDKHPEATRIANRTELCKKLIAGGYPITIATLSKVSPTKYRVKKKRKKARKKAAPAGLLVAIVNLFTKEKIMSGFEEWRTEKAAQIQTNHRQKSGD